MTASVGGAFAVQVPNCLFSSCMVQQTGVCVEVVPKQEGTPTESRRLRDPMYQSAERAVPGVDGNSWNPLSFPRFSAKRERPVTLVLSGGWLGVLSAGRGRWLWWDIPCRPVMLRRSHYYERSTRPANDRASQSLVTHGVQRRNTGKYSPASGIAGNISRILRQNV